MISSAELARAVSLALHAIVVITVTATLIACVAGIVVITLEQRRRGR